MAKVQFMNVKVSQRYKPVDGQGRTFAVIQEQYGSEFKVSSDVDLTTLPDAVLNFECDLENRAGKSGRYLFLATVEGVEVVKGG